MDETQSRAIRRWRWTLISLVVFAPLSMLIYLYSEAPFWLKICAVGFHITAIVVVCIAALKLHRAEKAPE